jgi:hypothetical protein
VHHHRRLHDSLACLSSGLANSAKIRILLLKTTAVTLLLINCLSFSVLLLLSSHFRTSDQDRTVTVDAKCVIIRWRCHSARLPPPRPTPSMPRPAATASATAATRLRWLPNAVGPWRPRPAAMATVATASATAATRLFWLRPGPDCRGDPLVATATPWMVHPAAAPQSGWAMEALPCRRSSNAASPSPASRPTDPSRRWIRQTAKSESLSYTHTCT